MTKTSFMCRIERGLCLILRSCSLSDAARCAWGFDHHKDSSLVGVRIGRETRCMKQAEILLRLGGLKTIHLFFLIY